MSQPDERPDSVVAGLRAGGSAGPRQVDAAFRRRLIGLADRLLDARLRAKLDPEDIAQSVFRTFFRRDAAAPFPVHSRFELWKLLAKIARRKCRRAASAHLARKRDARREVAADPSAEEPAGGNPADPTAVPPEAEAVMADLWEQLRAGLDDHHRRVCEMRLDGHEVAEIAADLGVSSRTVERRLVRIRAKLESLVGREPDPGPHGEAPV